jgi:hypothetical protein
MINADRFIIIIGILINLVLITGLIFGKKIIKNQTKTEFNSKYGVCLAILFALYFITIIILTIIAFIHNLYFFGIILSLFLIIPFVVGNLSSFEKAEFFVNIQVLSLFLSFFIITSMMGSLQVQSMKLSDKTTEPSINNELMSHHFEILYRFKKNISTLVRPYNHALKKMIKTKTN